LAIPGRRSVLFGGLTGALLAGGMRQARAAADMPGVPATGRLAFQVFREDSQIGTETVTFHPSGDALTVHVAADFKVGLGPIALFRYSLRTTENWQGGRLMSANSQADDNGTPASMTARRQGDALAVQGSKSGHYIAPPGSILGTHWNRAELKAPMINPENGELMHFSVTDRGTEEIKSAGEGLQATHYALTGFATLDLWYDRQSVWSALRAVAKDGSIIDYRLA
jgi:hypothetical protein